MMKYKIGDKVILRDDLPYQVWLQLLGETYRKMKSPKIVTIKDVFEESDVYHLEEIRDSWVEGEIVELYLEPEPILTRFELLDIRTE